MNRVVQRATALASILLMLSAVTAPLRAGEPADDLKQIEYKYYFRGKYPQAIEALQTFLARVDVTGPVAQRAGEFLAASHVLAGTPQTGKDVFARIIAADPAYPGPDPDVFKPEVMDVYAQARAERASLVMQTPSTAAVDSLPAAAAPANVATPTSSPIYKKWWFYAGAAAILGVVAGVAASGGDAAPAPTGTLTIGVRVQ
jgi:hypothetical protein